MTTAEAEARATVQLLLEGGEDLPAQLRDRLLGHGAAAVAPLCELVCDDRLIWVDAPGGGYASAHAAELLGELGAPEAVAPLLSALARTDDRDPLHDRVRCALPRLGRPVLEPALAALPGADEAGRTSLLAVLADLEIFDDRVLALLLAQLESDPVEAVCNLTVVGGPRVLPLLSEALDRAIPQPGVPLGLRQVIELSTGIESLGGTLTEGQREKHVVAEAATAGLPEEGMMATAQDEAAEAVELLLECGATLPSDLHDRIAGLGAAAVGPLCELLEDDLLDGEDAQGGGHAPVHAVRLLGELGAAEAVEPMLHALARTEGLEDLHDRVVLSLPLLGRHALEPALAALPGAGPDARVSLLAILARLRVPDERIFAALVQQLAADPENAAGNLVAYGDPRTLPLLSEALDRAVPEPGGGFWSRDVIELAAAIEELGGTLTSGQEEKRAAAAAAGRLRGGLEGAFRSLLGARLGGARPAPARRQERPGRNDPCRCGSEKKYKRCCLIADEATGPGSDL